ncbi:VOC family protein [Agromyces seonyuensis]|uniref:VOC family protein n=1 Tax=Agromyces seonyuensis TaxID=2662446 RepID=A0A6I4NX86_9MICO|nr:VOC family protein [Agromyces seonyuensis]MWB97125.1 VOC family protein [Agromyces seonyuensis]
MDITIQNSFLPHVDPDESIAFYREVLGFEVRMDIGHGPIRWVTIGSPAQPDTAIVLYPPSATPGLTDDEQQTIAELMAKGSFGTVVLASDDVDGAFEQAVAGGAEIAQEPIDQPYGVRDCALRDPAGNMIRIQAAH